ncbi:MAG TPA: heavy metal translocating P-type ATPase, partial [Thermoleophilia bacterium]|nr:heavy metal translocating P-type ATPase [Thermoleophilia bacterium]
EQLPVDGTVVDGQAGVDQSPVTGESMPVGRAPGDEVFAGSIVQGGTLTVRATTSASDNTIAKIIHLVEEAQAQRAPVQTTVDRFAARYTPVVVALAAAVAIVPPLFFGQAFDTWFYRGLALLIISCPCALVISTPVSILAALGAAGRRGVLIKGGAYLEQAGRLRAVAFDKTGTLTTGVPQVTDVVSLNGDTGERVLALAAAVERQSEHPLARAILDEADRLDGGGPASGDTRLTTASAGVAATPLPGATAGCADDCCCEVGADQLEHAHDGHAHEPGSDGHEHGSEGEHVHGEHVHGSDGHEHGHGHDHGHTDPDGPVVTRFRAIAGQGVRADVDGRTVLIGKPAMFGDALTHNGLFAAELRRLELEGKTVVVVGTPERVEGLIAVADAIRPHAADAVRALRASGVRHVALLTGDNQETAEAIGRAAGADVVRAGLLPEQKVAAVRELNERYGAVAMVGDGVNDAPALAAASLGVAMGAAGTDAALETADIALMGDDLTAVAATVALSRRTTRVIVENIVLSIAIKSVFLVLAPLGLIPLWLAVFADMGTSLAVIGNGMRLRFALRR